MAPRLLRLTCALAATVAVFASGTMIAQSAPASGKFPELRVDANRDGSVDLTGDSDVSKSPATFQSGAIFLPNLDDDSRRCSSSTEACNDASDEIVNGDADAADLAPIKTAPASWLPDGTTGSFTITAPANAVRVFLKRGSSYEVVTASTKVNAAELRAGLTLGIEGRDILRDKSRWDGSVSIQLLIDSGHQESRSQVSLRQAPMVTHTHTQNLQTLIATPASGYRQYTSDLNDALRNAGLPNFNHIGGNDQWTQDFFEAMYVSMPKPGGVQGMRLLVRSDQNRPAQLQLYTLRGSDVGVIKLAERPNGNTRNSFGNLETIPAHPGYPAGRIVIGFEDGSYENPSATLMTTLEAQQVQSPLRLDTGWLVVGHVDEFLQFLPAKNARGFVLAVADPNSAISVLKKAEADGNGNVSASQKGTLARMTVSQLLRDRSFLNDQETAQRAIDASVATLKREVNLSDSDIIRVPGAYVTENGSAYVTSANGKLSQKQAAEVGMKKSQTRTKAVAPMGALYPGAINSVVTSSSTIAAAKQFGPVVGGKDIMAEGVSAAYAKVGMKVNWVDDYDTYHVLQGEVHCGSNSLRVIGRWWV